jgi:uncharacterized phage-associated protein
MYPSQFIAYYFIKLALDDNNDTITPMKLQKLIYFAHGFYLAQFKDPLIQESFYAWKFGPVVIEVYNEFKIYGTDSIIDDQQFPSRHLPLVKIIEKIIEEPAKSFLSQIWENFKNYSELELSTFTYAGESPWDIVTGPFKDHIEILPSHIVIPNYIISSYFEEVTGSNKARAKVTVG